jgi:copper chaperone CopZ
MQLHIPELRCGFCAVSITRGIEAVRGRARVDLARRTSTVSDNLDAELARRMVRALGYAVLDPADDVGPASAASDAPP